MNRTIFGVSFCSTVNSSLLQTTKTQEVWQCFRAQLVKIPVDDHQHDTNFQMQLKKKPKQPKPLYLVELLHFAPHKTSLKWCFTLQDVQIQF